MAQEATLALALLPPSAPLAADALDHDLDDADAPDFPVPLPSYDPAATVLIFPSAPVAPPPHPPRLGASRPGPRDRDRQEPETEPGARDPLSLSNYSLLDDIRDNARQNPASASRERISLYSFPSYLATNLRRVLSRDTSRHADWNTALSCLLHRGLVRYQALPSAQALAAQLSGLDLSDAVDTVAMEQVELWRRGFRFSIPDPTHSLGFEKCRRFRAPEYLVSDLGEFAGRIGLGASALGVAAVAAALEVQEGVLPEHGTYMRDIVGGLDKMLEERVRRLRGMMRAVGAADAEPGSGAGSRRTRD